MVNFKISLLMCVCVCVCGGGGGLPQVGLEGKFKGDWKSLNENLCQP